MTDKRIYIAGDTPAVLRAALELKNRGFTLTADMDEAEAVLYNIPTPAFLLDDIPVGPTIIGGNLDFLENGHRKFDLLKDADYVARNAALTAEAALGILLPKLETDFADTPTLILGWGRIGKCVARMLKNLGFPVSVYARKESDRAMLGALGYGVADLDGHGYRCIINTVPSPLLEECESMCIKLDLASVKGLPGNDVIHARGLPGKHKPEASGQLIAKTIIDHWKEI